MAAGVTLNLADRWYRTRMRWLHRGTSPQEPFAGSGIDAAADHMAAGLRDLMAHCRRKPFFPSGPDGRMWRCDWCGRIAR